MEVLFTGLTPGNAGQPIKIVPCYTREKERERQSYNLFLFYLNSDEWLSRKDCLFNSSSITVSASFGTVIDDIFSRNLSNMAFLSSFYNKNNFINLSSPVTTPQFLSLSITSIPSSLLIIFSCSCNKYFLCILVNFSST